MTNNKTEEDLAAAAADAALAEEALDGAEPMPEEEPGPEAVIAALEAERDELRDRLMRALAEAENIRKRAERDRRDAEAYGGTKLARDVLAVHDNLGRAMAAMDDDLRAKAGGLIEGVELTQRELLNAFAKHKIGVIHPEIGEKFDAKMHQAMFEAPVPHAKPGSVIQVMQDGFMISDRLLRPAMVGVAAAGSGADLTDDAPAPETPEDG